MVRVHADLSFQVNALIFYVDFLSVFVVCQTVLRYALKRSILVTCNADHRLSDARDPPSILCKSLHLVIVVG
jgi:hypothetical protein